MEKSTFLEWIFENKGSCSGEQFECETFSTSFLTKTASRPSRNSISLSVIINQVLKIIVKICEKRNFSRIFDKNFLLKVFFHNFFKKFSKTKLHFHLYNSSCEIWKLERYNEGIEKMRFTSNIYAKLCFDSNDIMYEIWESGRLLRLFNSWGTTFLIFHNYSFKISAQNVQNTEMGN